MYLFNCEQNALVKWEFYGQSIRSMRGNEGSHPKLKHYPEGGEHKIPSGYRHICRFLFLIFLDLYSFKALLLLDRVTTLWKSEKKNTNEKKKERRRRINKRRDRIINCIHKFFSNASKIYFLSPFEKRPIARHCTNIFKRSQTFPNA